MAISKDDGSIKTMGFVLERLSYLDATADSHADPSRILIAGWDFTTDRSAVDAPTAGVWRSPQFVPKRSECGWQAGMPILAMDMTVEQLAAGLWRQLKVYPVASEERDADVSADAFTDSYGRIGSRDRSLEPFLGISVRALAIFVDDLRGSDPNLAHALLSKNFISLDQDVAQLAMIRWPTACLKQFDEEGRKSVIPPVLALILHAGLAQFAQTHAGHLSLSFEAGNEIRPKSLIGLLGSSDAGCQHQVASQVADNFPMQTLAWMDHQSAGKIPKLKMREWLLSSGYRGLISGTRNAEDVARLLVTHPGSFGRRSGQSTVLAQTAAVTRFGLTWRDSAALNLLIIHNQMTAWMTKYEQKLKRLRKASSLGWRPGSLPEAMSRMLHFWLETVVPDAAENELRHVINSSCDEPGQPVESVGGKDVGRQMLERARKLSSLFDRPSAIGYSALAHPSLWLCKVTPDQTEFNHLGEAARCDLRIEQSMSRIPQSVVEAMSLNGVRAASRARRRRAQTIPLDSEVAVASRAAQALSMMMHAQAMDPMHKALLDRLR